MAEIDGIYLKLTMLEVRALHRALGRMSSADFKNTAQAEAGNMVYAALVPYADAEDD